MFEPCSLENTSLPLIIRAFAYITLEYIACTPEIYPPTSEPTVILFAYIAFECSVCTPEIYPPAPEPTIILLAPVIFPVKFKLPAIVPVVTPTNTLAFVKYLLLTPSGT